MYLGIFYFLILAIVISGFGGRFFSKSSIAFINSVGVAAAFIISVFIFIEVIFLDSTCIIPMGNWINISTLHGVKIEFLFDPLSTYMVLIILLISLSIHIYSIEYMWHDPSFIRFLCYLTIFTFFMLIMVTSGNFIQFFVGWEGIGLASYLLINFWFCRPEANRSAIKAVILNKFGDFGLYLALILMYIYFKTFDFYSIFGILELVSNNIVFKFFNISFSKFDILSLLLLIAAFGKSAQLGLHSWLPDAMEGPTPVSALLHSATMVTAGIFLLIRSSFIIEKSQMCLDIFSILGLTTSILASLVAMSQFDLKKSIAYSTTSQLAYMISSCGFSQYLLALQHLFDHAFFKAVLFLCAGSIIHSCAGLQDIRELGDLRKTMPITFFCFLIANFSLIALPGTSGFYSKDFIIDSSYYFNSFSQLIIILNIISVSFSSYYSIQTLFLSFFGRNNNNIKPMESSVFILIPIIVLTFCGLFSGILFSDLFINNTNIFNNSLYLNFYEYNLPEFFDDLIWHIIIELPFYLTLFGVFIMLFFQYQFTNLFNFLFGEFILINFNRKFFFDSIIFFTFLILMLFYYYIKFLKFVDRGIFENIGPLGLVYFLNKIAIKINNYETGLLYYYIFTIIFFISVLLLFFITYAMWFTFDFLYMLILIIPLVFYFLIFVKF